MRFHALFTQVRRLVEEGGAKPAAEDGAGKTPLQLAEAAKHTDVADYLRWAVTQATHGSSAVGPGAAAQLAAAAAARFGALPKYDKPAAAPAAAQKEAAPAALMIGKRAVMRRDLTIA